MIYANYNSALLRLHTIHGILAAFPFVLFTSSLVSDIAYLRTYQVQWTNFSSWLIAGGLFVGALSLLMGLVRVVLDQTLRRVKSFWLYALAASAGWAVQLVNAFVHSRDGFTSVVPLGIFLSLAGVGTFFLASWLLYSGFGAKEYRS